jgi:hypothetical protein
MGLFRGNNKVKRFVVLKGDKHQETVTKFPVCINNERNAQEVMTWTIAVKKFLTILTDKLK